MHWVTSCQDLFILLSYSFVSVLLCLASEQGFWRISVIVFCAWYVKKYSAWIHQLMDWVWIECKIQVINLRSQWFVKWWTSIFNLFTIRGDRNEIKYEHIEVQRMKVWKLNSLSGFIGVLFDVPLIKPETNSSASCLKNVNILYSEGSFYHFKERKCISMHKVSGN